MVSRAEWEAAQEVEYEFYSQWRPEFLFDLPAMMKFVAFNDGRPTQERINAFVNRARTILERGVAYVYRGMDVPRGRGLNAINFNCLGRSWTDHRDSAASYWAGETTKGVAVADMRLVIIEGMASSDAVDWGDTLRSNGLYPEQNEVVLRPLAPVMIGGVFALAAGEASGEAITVATDYRRISPPIKGNTGPANKPDPTGRIRHDEWNRTCRMNTANQGYAPISSYYDYDDTEE